MGMTQEQAFNRAKYVGDTVGALLASGKKIGLKDFQDTAATLVADHLFSVKDAAQIIANAAAMPEDQLPQLAKQYYAMAQRSAAMLAPQPTAIDNGQTIGLVNTNPMAGQVGAPMAGFQKQLSPGEQAQ